MNEHRQEDYLQLIQNLLNCRNHDEIQEILIASQDLLDSRFLGMVEAAAQIFSQQGDENTANRLQGLATQQREALKTFPQTIEKKESSLQVYFQFLMEVLKVAADGNAQIVYPLLSKNTDKLNGIFAKILDLWGRIKLKKVETSEGKTIAASIGNLSNLLLQFSLGNTANNIEIAIAGYEVILTVYTKDALPLEWAKAQHNLANAYSNRIQGEKAENLELAIAFYKKALTIRNKESFPYEWATIQNNLGIAYNDRIRGEKVENIEQAIAFYKKALTIRSKESFPCEWADTQNNLGMAYGDRIRGDKSENIELAIACYQKALTIRNKESFPYEWATIQNNLGNAYCKRIKGEKAENLELAIAAYNSVLTVRTKETLPVYWAMTQNNLGNAYHQRIKGEKAENLELAINAHNKSLTVATRKDLPVNWAMTQNSLGNAYLQRIQGEKVENLELAINAYNAALTIYTKEAFPKDWSDIQNNLGNAYRERIQGDRAENIELAINACNAALSIRSKNTLPLDWAMTQNNLGNAYLERIQGDRAENIELAIKAYNAALSVRTQEAFPYEWAMTQTNLGAAYRDRILNQKTENIELSITAYNLALNVYTQKAFPYEWAELHNNLGNSYRDRIRGDKAENLESAITAHKNSLSVYTQEAFPYKWARAQNNLGADYGDRIMGNRAENIESAIATYNNALIIYTKEAFPEDWALIKNNLGVTYPNRIWGDRAENIESAITACNDALIVYTKETFPLFWAETQNNLGNAYRERIRGDEAENIESAITAYQNALTVRTREALPLYWADVQNNLGIAYNHRVIGEKAENIELAIATFNDALAIYTQQTFPQVYATVSLNLAILYQDNNQFILACNIFESAITTVESLREEIVSGEETKRKQSEEWNGLYNRMVEVCLELDKITEAIEYAERSKTRNLVEQILERDSKNIFPPDVVTQLEKYRDEIATGQYQIQNGKAEKPQELAQHLQQLRQQRNELQSRYLPVGYSFKFDSFQPNLDEHTAIIEWYVFDDKIVAFVVTHKGEVTVWESQAEDRKSFNKWSIEYFHEYDEQKYQWQKNLAEELKKLASILHIDEILNQIPKHCEKLILIPHRFLHLFPLHALPITSQNNQDSRCLLDLFSGGVSYAPSCQLLQQVQQRKRPDFQNLFAIQNPTEDLNFTDLEVEAILSYFPSHQVLPKKQATKAALSQAATQLKQANYLHFSCHGSFNLNSPQDSCLLLAESVDENNKLDLNKCLTLGNLFERTFDFSQTRLVVLSACETGLVDFKNTSDEYISLPSGFLYAGSSSVVSSLWTVKDLSTAFLMIKFIQNLKATMVDNGDFSVAVELQKAQLWLRNVTTAELQTWTNDLNLSSEEAKQNFKTLGWFDDDEKPFQNPVYWAAFCAIGQ